MTQVEGYHLLPVPAGWAAVQVSSAVVLIVLIKPLQLHILALSLSYKLKVSPKMFPKKYLPEDRLRQKICQSSPELRALAAKLEQVITIFQDDDVLDEIQ